MYRIFSQCLRRSQLHYDMQEADHILHTVLEAAGILFHRYLALFLQGNFQRKLGQSSWNRCSIESTFLYYKSKNVCYLGSTVQLDEYLCWKIASNSWQWFLEYDNKDCYVPTFSRFFPGYVEVTLYHVSCLQRFGTKETSLPLYNSLATKAKVHEPKCQNISLCLWDHKIVPINNLLIAHKLYTTYWIFCKIDWKLK